MRKELPSSGPKFQPTNVVLTCEQVRQIDVIAQEMSVNRSTIVRFAIRDYLRNNSDSSPGTKELGR